MLDAIAFNLVALAVALTWALLLRVRPMALLPAVIVTLYVVVAQAWVLVTGLVGRLNVVAWRFTAAGLVFALIIAWGVGSPYLRGELTRWRARLDRTRRTLGAWRVTLLALLAVSMLIWIAAAGWMIGPWLPDVQSYHLLTPGDWVADGAITQRDWPDVRCYWPAGNGLLMAWWMAPLHALRGAVLVGVAWSALTLAAAWALARQMGATVRVAWAAVLLAMCVPIVWAQGTIALNDMATAALALVAVAAVAGRHVRPAHVVLALAAIAVGLGVKASMLLLAPPIVVAAVFRWLRHRRPAGVDPAASSARRALLVTTLVLTAAIGSVWYVRNVAVLPQHNPLYPAPLNILGHTVFEGHPHFSRQHGHFSVKQFTGNAFDIFYSKGWDRTGPRGGQTPNSTGFGLLAMAIGWPAMLALLVFAPRARPAILIVIVMMLLLMAGVEDDPWAGRFFAFVPITLVVCIAVVTPRLFTPRGRTPTAARQMPLLLWYALLASAALWSVGVAVRDSAPPIAWSVWKLQGVGDISLSTMMIGHPNGYLHDAAKVVPPDATLAVVVPAARPYVPIAGLHGPGVTRRFVYYADPDGALPNRAQLDAWRRAGVHWVCVVTRADELAATDAAMERTGFTRAAEGIYEIR
ncbi:MAG: hypothetical protein GC159_05050 [Phycisphaera sp.]|nr:hypothetical protein [Phycisphaera sp.]